MGFWFCLCPISLWYETQKASKIKLAFLIGRLSPDWTIVRNSTFPVKNEATFWIYDLHTHQKKHLVFVSGVLPKSALFKIRADCADYFHHRILWMHCARHSSSAAWSNSQIHGLERNRVRQIRTPGWFPALSGWLQTRSSSGSAIFMPQVHRIFRWVDSLTFCDDSRSKSKNLNQLCFG